MKLCDVVVDFLVVEVDVDLVVVDVVSVDVVGVGCSVVGAYPPEQYGVSLKMMLLMKGLDWLKWTMMPISRVVPASMSPSQE